MYFVHKYANLHIFIYIYVHSLCADIYYILCISCDIFLKCGIGLLTASMCEWVLISYTAFFQAQYFIKYFRNIFEPNGSDEY